VNLGFNDGAALADPKGILEGTGNRIRHLTIKTPADLARLRFGITLSARASSHWPKRRNSEDRPRRNQKAWFQL